MTKRGTTFYDWEGNRRWCMGWLPLPLSVCVSCICVWRGVCNSVACASYSVAESQSPVTLRCTNW